MKEYEWGEQLPILKGQSVLLRALEQADVSDVLAVFADADAMGRWNPMNSIADAEAFIQKADLGFARRQRFRWGIADKGTNRIIGSCALFFVDIDRCRGEIGFALAPSRWGQGIASDAVATMINFIFQTVGLHRLEAFTRPENARSSRLLERLGFQKEGYLRQRYRVDGAAVNAVVYGLLAPEWADGATLRG